MAIEEVLLIGTRREIGSDLDRHRLSSQRMAEHLEHVAPGWIIRIGTDGRTVAEVADDVIAHSVWSV